MATVVRAREEVSEDLHQVLGRSRVVGAGLLLAAMGIVLVDGAEPWRIGLLAGLLGLLVASLALDLPRREQVHVLLGGVFLVQLAAMVATGGFASPLVVTPIPIALMAGLALPLRVALALVAPVAAAVLVLAGLETAAWDDFMVLPALDRRTGPAGAWALAAVIAVAVVVGAAIGNSLRAVLERSATRRRRVEAEARAVVEDRNREILALSAAVAHELKNPLAAIQGLSTLLARRAAAGSADAEKFEVLVSEVRRMSAILDEFLSFSRPVTELTVAPVRLDGLVEEVVLLHEAAAEERSVRIAAEVAPELQVLCDTRKIKQILVNLLQNALQAAPAGSAIRIGAGQGPDGTVLTVEDQGPGLPAEVRERLFTPGVTSKPDGSGLGLTIALTLAEQHGGRLEVGDRPGGGCRASLVLPPAREAAA